MYTSLKDRNTKVVYEWIKDTGERKLVPVENWKTAEEWTKEEITALFEEAVDEVREEEDEPELKGFTPPQKKGLLGF